MFFTIDNKLILASQWTIRQIELYTPITRKNIGDMLLLTWKTTTMVFAVLISSLLIMSVLSPSSLVIDFLNLYFIVSQHKDLINKFVKSYSNKENLPDEIITRKYQRIFLLVLSFAIFLATILGYIYYQIYPEMLESRKAISDQVSSYYLIDIYAVFFLLYYLTEYFLCTLSLPPGEKEKRKVEKEMRNLVPIPIR